MDAGRGCRVDSANMTVAEETDILREIAAYKRDFVARAKDGPFARRRALAGAGLSRSLSISAAP